MAKKRASQGDVNVMGEVKAYLDEHPREKPKQIQQAMAEKGIDVKTTYISTIKSNYKKSNGKGKGKAKGKKGKSSPTQDVAQATQLLMQAVDLVVKAGVKEAQALVSAAGDMAGKFSSKR